MAPLATAQTADPMAQVPQSVSRSAVAAAPDQVGRTVAQDRTSVTQLPAGLGERKGSGASPASEEESPIVIEPLNLASSGRNAGSVDADEIAALLAKGEAASIDAAAAIASGATDETLRARRALEAELRAQTLQRSLIPQNMNDGN